MDGWLIYGVGLLVAGLALGLMAWRRREEGRLQLYGPLPEREREDESVMEPAGTEPTRPGALGAEAAGPTETIYTATGPTEGPASYREGARVESLGGPAMGYSQGRSREDLGADWAAAVSQEEGGRMVPVWLVGAIGGVVGLLVALFWRRRMRRRSRLQRLRERARKVAWTAAEQVTPLPRQARRAASAASDAAAALPYTVADNVDTRALGGGTAALLAALSLYGALRRRAEQERRDEEARRAAEEAARAEVASIWSRAQRRLGMACAAGWRERDELMSASRARLTEAISGWTLAGLVVLLLVIVARGAASARVREDDWLQGAAPEAPASFEPPPAI